MKRSILLLLTIISLVGLLMATPLTKTGEPSNKLTVEEIISKHLDSIGKPEARTAAHSRVIAGTTQVTFRARGVAQTTGGAVLASDGAMSMVTMKFESSDYPYEKLGFDGSKVTAYQLHPNDYSSLGNFARSFPEIFKEGLFGGTLSSAWPLLNSANKKVKLEYAGTKKVDSRQLLEVKYLPRNGSDLEISLFFDPATFQHVRTVYKRTISSQMGRTPGESASLSATYYELDEDFSDFKTEGGLTLPHTYKIHLGQTGSSSQYSDWVMTLIRFVFNQHLEARDFDVSSE
jgi:hypothetical protein